LLLSLFLDRGVRTAWVLLITVTSLRIAVALLVGLSVLRDRQVPRLLPLLPLRDLVALLVWTASLVGRRVVWRGQSFRLKNGKLVRVDS
jgi:ceramide glucosyltransferase